MQNPKMRFRKPETVGQRKELSRIGNQNLKAVLIRIQKPANPNIKATDSGNLKFQNPEIDYSATKIEK